MGQESRRDTIRDAVKELLGRSGAFRSLPSERQREVASSLWICSGLASRCRVQFTT